MTTLNTAARYVSLFLQASSYSGWILLFSWVSSSFPRPPAKRAVAIALINSFCQLGNVAGSYIWDQPENGYRKSYGVVLAMFGSTIICLYIFRMMLANLNKKLEAREAGDGADCAAQDPSNEALNTVKGFRYLV
jgi:hypothetical protein